MLANRPINGDEAVFVGVTQRGIIEVAGQQRPPGSASPGFDKQGGARDHFLQVEKGVTEHEAVA